MGIQNHAIEIQEDAYPIHSLDDTKVNRCFVTWMMRFNDVLDPKKLNDSLSRLLEIGDWKKLGGRLRYKENGKLEVYMPKPSVEYPSVAFTENSFDVKIEDHSLASHLPKRTDTSSIQLVSEDFRPLVARPDFPLFDEMVQQGLPQISLHVTCFRDATLVGLAWPHVMMDAMAGRALLVGWSSVLAGREEVPEVVGARNDILRDPEITSNQDEVNEPELELDHHRMSKIGLVMFGLRFLWDKLWDSPRSHKVIFIPKQALASFCARARQDVADETQEKSFISESDALTAWVARAVASSTAKSRPVTVVNLVNARFRIPLLLRSSGTFLQNMVLGTFSMLSDISNKSLGAIARDNRRYITEQGSEKQYVGLLRRVFDDMDAGRTPAGIYGPTNAVPVVINNVIKVDIIKTVDFSAAVVSQGEATETRNNPVGTMVTYWNERLHKQYDGYNILVMLGKDYEQNCWMLGTLLPRTWAKLEEELRNFPA